MDLNKPRRRLALAVAAVVPARQLLAHFGTHGPSTNTKHEKISTLHKQALAWLPARPPGCRRGMQSSNPKLRSPTDLGSMSVPSRLAKRPEEASKMDGA